MYDRRTFLKSVLGAAGGVSLGVGVTTRADARATGKVLVQVFLRGGIDGLNTIVPYADPNYYKARPSIAIGRPKSGKDAAIQLDGQFGLHPALAPLEPLYRNQTLGLIHAVGSPAPTRSHFDAQDNLETAAISGNPRDGWLGRVVHDRGQSQFSVVATGKGVPLSLRGSDALAVGKLAKFGLAGKGRVQERLERGFSALYGEGADDIVAPAGRQALEAIARVRGLKPKAYRPANGAKYGKGSAAQQLRDVALLIKGDVGVSVAAVDVGGWDTHTQEKGRLNRGLSQLSQALAAFSQDLGNKMDDVLVLVVSEFGRTVKENGSGGTDHGHGTMMMLMGGGVRGGRVYGRWPGLAPDALYEGRDLAVTTDFRTVYAEVLGKHLGIDNPAATFPGGAPNAAALGLLKG